MSPATMRLDLLLAVSVSLQVPPPQGAAALVWDAPPDCPDRAALQRAIERRLARPLAAGELVLTGQVTRHPTPPRYRLRLHLGLGEHSQQRTLSAERCTSLVDASAVLVAAAVTDARAASDTAEPAAPIDPPPETPPPDPPPTASESLAPLATPPDPPPAPREPPPREPIAPPPAEVLADPPEPPPIPALPPPRTPGGVLRLQGGTEYGAVPGVTGAVGLATGLLWPRARLELQGIYLAPRTRTLGQSSAQVSLFAGSLHGCYRAGRGALELPLCGGFEAGGLRARVQGPGARTATGLWLAVLASAGVAWHLHRRVSLSLALQAGVHLTLPTFQLAVPGPSTTLFRPQYGAGRLLLGLEWRFGDRW